MVSALLYWSAHFCARVLAGTRRPVVVVLSIGDRDGDDEGRQDAECREPPVQDRTSAVDGTSPGCPLGRPWLQRHATSMGSMG